ncbi:MAG: DNA polymerase III subunit beta [Myxococcota bacterium]
MKVRIARETLTNELFKVQGVTNQKSTLLILNNALLEARDGQLTIHATDLDVSISTSCPCDVLEEGSVTLQAKRLFDMVKSLRDSELTLETEANHHTRLKAGNVNCRFPGTPSSEFPEVPDHSKVQFHAMGTARLLDMIEKTLFSVSTDEGRPNLNGALLKSSDDKGTLTMVSTDGHRLSRIEMAPAEDAMSGDIPEALSRGIIIPRKGLTEVKRTLNIEESELLFGLHGNNIVFKHGPATISIRLIDGKFPDVDKVLPKETDKKARIPKEDFIHSLKFVSIVAPPRTGNIRVTFEEGQCEIFTQDAEQGEAKEVVSIDYDGTSVKAGYNYRYLLDVLNVIDGDQITMEIIDTLSPTLIRDATPRPNCETLFVVMPMRI